MSARNPKPTRGYCGAKPPTGRLTATCILSAGHAPKHPHRNMEGLSWTDEEGVIAQVYAVIAAEAAAAGEPLPAWGDLSTVFRHAVINGLIGPLRSVAQVARTAGKEA